MGRSHAHGHRRGRQRQAPRGRRPRPQLVGTVHVNRPGTALVETAEGSFPIAKGGLHEAMNDDEVQVFLVTRHGGQRMAIVSSVTSRAATTFAGLYEEADSLGVVRPLDERLGHDFFVPPEDRSARRVHAQPGDIVMARITDYPTRHSAATATIERRMGPSEELDLGMETVVASYGLAADFSAATQDQAAALHVDVEKALSEEVERQDLRNLCAFTIDPSDARDFDDAVGASKMPDGGFEVWVHIADVSQYVGWNSPIDLEARQRTCSVYLADRVIPMLPERLCDNLCSLVPGQDRLCVSICLHLDKRGRVLDAQAMPSVIHSRVRLDYDLVERLLEGGAGVRELSCEHEADAAWVASGIRVLDEVAGLRRGIRRQRGAIDFDTPEAKVLLDAEGHPEGVRVRERTRATSLVEEAMLMANEEVARKLSDAGLATVYRIHERPAPEHLKAAVPIFQELGLLGRVSKDAFVAGEPRALQQVLDTARSTSAELLVNAVLLRAQKRAIYLPKNEGHYALGASAYCHFTSPIRRYPDLMVHQALKGLLAARTPSKLQAEQEASLPQICADCSRLERNADAASRASQKIKMAELYAGHIGESFSGVVSSVERYGLFVTLDESYAEGLLPTRRLGDEWFTYDEARMTLTGEESGRTWRPGRRIAVRVVATTPARGQIDFALADGRTANHASNARVGTDR